MISHRHKCIFFQVPKCATTTIINWFLRHGKGRLILTPWWYGSILTDRVKVVTRVMNLYPDYFTFTFVRNPYERFVSLFLDATRRYAARGFPGDLGTLRDFAELCRDVLGDTGHLWGREARDFFRENGEREYGPGRVKLKHLAWVTYHARPQVDFLPDCNPQRLFGVRRDDDAPLSFIGTVEDVEADFRRLHTILGLPAVELPNRNTLRTRNGHRAPQEIPWVLRRRNAPAGGGSLRRGPGVHRLRLRGGTHDDTVPARPSPRTLRTPRRRAGTFFARVWFNLSSSEVCVRAWYIRHLVTRHLLRPLKRLCRFPR